MFKERPIFHIYGATVVSIKKCKCTPRCSPSCCVTKGWNTPKYSLYGFTIKAHQWTQIWRFLPSIWFYIVPLWYCCFNHELWVYSVCTLTAVALQNHTCVCTPDSVQCMYTRQGPPLSFCYSWIGGRQCYLMFSCVDNSLLSSTDWHTLSQTLDKHESIF